MSLKKAVIWGHPLYSHTHSFIHYAFFKAFLAMGYETYWLDNSSDLSGLNLANSLFITECQVDQDIPLRKDCKYVLHNCAPEKYQGLASINLQVYNIDVSHDWQKIAPFTYFDGRTLYQPWATDLLPSEIEGILEEGLEEEARDEKTCAWIGTVGEGLYGNLNELTPFIKECEKNGVRWRAVMNIPFEENRKMIRSSWLAPAITGGWQTEHGYIPCRMFKNASYGKLGITNSAQTRDIMDGLVAYSQDTAELFYKALEARSDLKMIRRAAQHVAAHHTYLNRIENMLKVLP